MAASDHPLYGERYQPDLHYLASGLAMAAQALLQGDRSEGKFLTAWVNRFRWYQQQELGMGEERWDVPGVEWVDPDIVE